MLGIIEKTLSGLDSLDYTVKVFIPSKEGNIEIEKDKRGAWVIRILNEFGGSFGGATTTEHKGAWRNGKGVVIEDITTIESFSTEEKLSEHINSVVELCKELKSGLNQDSVALQVNGKMFFV